MWGWIGKLLGFGNDGGIAPVTSIANATTSVAEVFVENRTRKMELQASAKQAALAQFAAEFAHARQGIFDRFVDALNRLPRPLMALGTLFLFFQAWYNPDTFVEVMVALQTVPEPLWWLLGAIVSFYFGAREAYHFRKSGRDTQALRVAQDVLPDSDDLPIEPPDSAPDGALGQDGDPNPALDAMRAQTSEETRP